MPAPKQPNDEDENRSEGGVADIAGEVVGECVGSVIEGAGGCLEGCGGCSAAVLVALTLAGTAMAGVRLWP